MCSCLLVPWSPSSSPLALRASRSVSPTREQWTQNARHVHRVVRVQHRRHARHGGCLALIWDRRHRSVQLWWLRGLAVVATAQLSLDPPPAIHGPFPVDQRPMNTPTADAQRPHPGLLKRSSYSLTDLSLPRVVFSANPPALGHARTPFSYPVVPVC